MAKRLMSQDRILERLSDRNLIVVAERTTISIATLYNITSGRTKKISQKNREILSDYLK